MTSSDQRTPFGHSKSPEFLQEETGATEGKVFIFQYFSVSSVSSCKKDWGIGIGWPPLPWCEMFRWNFATVTQDAARQSRRDRCPDAQMFSADAPTCDPRFEPANQWLLLVNPNKRGTIDA